MANRSKLRMHWRVSFWKISTTIPLHFVKTLFHLFFKACKATVSSTMSSSLVWTFLPMDLLCRRRHKAGNPTLCGKRLPPGIDSPQMSQRKRNNSRQIILTGILIGLMAWNHSQRFKLSRSQLSRSHDWFTGSTTTTTQRLNLKSQALIVYTEHCMQMAYG